MSRFRNGGIDDDNPMPMEPSHAAAAALLTGVAFDATDFGGVELEVSGLGGGDTLTVQRSLGGVNFFTATGLKEDMTTVTAIASDGIYAYPGGGYVKWSKTGSGSTPAILVRAGN